MIPMAPAMLAAVVQFGAPAGLLPVQPMGTGGFAAILPSGRIVEPLGSSVVTGVNAFGFAVASDGRFAVVADSGNGDQAQSSVAVVDTTTMHVIDRYAAAGQTYGAGVAAVPDPRRPRSALVFVAGGSAGVVYVLDLDVDGHLTPDVIPTIAITAGSPGAPLPVTSVDDVTSAPDGRHIYAVDRAADSVSAIDTTTRSVAAVQPVGYAPFAAALAGHRLLVTNPGRMRYLPIMPASLAPPFAAPVPDPLRASSLSFVDLAPGGGFALQPRGLPALSLDPAPDGLTIVGGAYPAAVAVTADAAYAYVAMTNVDRIATVALGATPRVVGGTELRLFDRGPYGTQPAALVRSADGTRLYVALSGLDAIAVLDARDPRRLHRLGLIPTGWLPTALALTRHDRQLLVLNSNGFGRPVGDDALAPPVSTLEKIDLSEIALGVTTRRTLRDTRVVQPRTPHYPPSVRDVVLVIAPGAGFDEIFGDLGLAASDARFVRFDSSLAPNLHALARRFAIAGNLFSDADRSCLTHQWIAGGSATLAALRAPVVGSGCAIAEPDLYPRAGYLFHALARRGISFRDYGDLMQLAGYDNGATDADPIAVPELDDRDAPTHGLGGRYGADVPAPAVLAAHVDTDYPGFDPGIRNERRAREFVRDYGAFARAGDTPRFAQVWLPSRGNDSESVVDSDRAVGLIADFLTHLPTWSQTVVFVVSDAAVAADHVAPMRGYGLVISPFAKPHYVGMHHLSAVSVLKTVEQIFALSPLALGDLLATDMSDFFTPHGDAQAFPAIGLALGGDGLTRVDRNRWSNAEGNHQAL